MMTKQEWLEDMSDLRLDLLIYSLSLDMII